MSDPERVETLVDAYQRLVDAGFAIERIATDAAHWTVDIDRNIERTLRGAGPIVRWYVNRRKKRVITKCFDLYDAAWKARQAVTDAFGN